MRIKTRYGQHNFNQILKENLSVKLKQRLAIPVGVALLGVCLLLAACGGTNSGANSNDQSSASNQFFADRSGTPDPNATPLPGAETFGGGAPGVFGTIQKIDGNKVTVTSAFTNTASTTNAAQTVVQVSNSTTISKQADAQASDIKVGDEITAIGTKDGDTVTAQIVQIGGGFGGFGGPGGFVGGRGNFPNASGTPGAGGRRAFPSGTPPAGFQGNGGNDGNGGGNFRGNFPNASGTPGVTADFISGTVNSVNGDTVTVKSTDGTSATFTITSDTRLQKSVDVKVSDLKEGDNITAMGQQNGDVFEATSIQVVERFTQQTSTP